MVNNINSSVINNGLSAAPPMAPALTAFSQSFQRICQTIRNLVRNFLLNWQISSLNKQLQILQLSSGPNGFTDAESAREAFNRLKGFIQTIHTASLDFEVNLWENNKISRSVRTALLGTLWASKQLDARFPSGKEYGDTAMLRVLSEFQIRKALANC